MQSIHPSIYPTTYPFLALTAPHPKGLMCFKAASRGKMRKKHNSHTVLHVQYLFFFKFFHVLLHSIHLSVLLSEYPSFPWWSVELQADWNFTSWAAGWEENKAFALCTVSGDCLLDRMLHLHVRLFVWGKCQAISQQDIIMLTETLEVQHWGSVLEVFCVEQIVIPVCSI